MGAFWGVPVRVELDFDARMATFVRGRLWHDSQRTEDLPDGRLRMTLEVSNDWALRSWLLGFGPAVRVIAPEALAEAILQDLEDAARRYHERTSA
jgi:predicted DNA-binding transcriptional regulator YafY